ncbi:ovomucoid-like [Pelodiscus sinensis]|uniref:ovomucoid-like n=1 Tax=Pelodiscus sinensis TaxID=13735 RepID=UPI0003C4976A|nr:ovomucoid-like [Pelodiscus sinensis]|eukprot:XP_006138151.1 ovomucoid-like [Pelodiscus sinensis]
MKTASIFIVFTLAYLCCFSGVVSEPANQLQNDCSAYPEPPMGKTLLCTKEYNPVYGTDGMMYDNICFLCAAKWKSGGKLSLQHAGLKRIDCRRYYGQSKDPRKINCDRMYAPVCGTNGVTYVNACRLCVEILNGAAIDLAHKGKCKKKDDCSEYSKSQKRKHIFCPTIYRPVCGTDGITYANKCSLCSAREKTGVNIGIKYEGTCNQKIK